MNKLSVLDILAAFKNRLGHLAVAGVEPHASLPRPNQDRDIVFNISYYLRVDESGQCFELQFSEKDLLQPIAIVMDEVMQLYCTWINTRVGAKT
jgi:hypothetical protein